MYASYFQKSNPFAIEKRIGALANGKLNEEAQMFFGEVIELLRKLTECFIASTVHSCQVAEIRADDIKAANVTDYNYEMVWCRSLFV